MLHRDALWVRRTGPPKGERRLHAQPRQLAFSQDLAGRVLVGAFVVPGLRRTEVFRDKGLRGWARQDAPLLVGRTLPVRDNREEADGPPARNRHKLALDVASGPERNATLAQKAKELRREVACQRFGIEPLRGVHKRKVSPRRRNDAMPRQRQRSRERGSRGTLAMDHRARPARRAALLQERPPPRRPFVRLSPEKKAETNGRIVEFHVPFHYYCRIFSYQS